MIRGKITPQIILFLVVVYLVGLSSACSDNREIRHSRETIKETQPATGVESKDHQEKAQPFELKWEAPGGWEAIKNTSPMRLASFSIPSAGPVETTGSPSAPMATCTVVPLRGSGGGLEANIQRWARQLNLKMEAGDIQGLIDKAERFQGATKKNSENQDVEGFPAVLVDFTGLTGTGQQESILVTMVNLPETTIFIKMAGPASVLLENKEKLKAFSRSFSMHPTLRAGTKTQQEEGRDQSKL